MIWNPIINFLLTLPAAFFGFLLTVGVLVSGGGVMVVGAILNWITGPAFVSLSYTNPEDNDIIKAGLNITQSFVNLGLVLILVYIALSIALRIGEHDAKKMFAKLIVVALLVNFAPVIVGLIVDATNIVMYYFLEPTRAGISDIAQQVTQYGEAVIGALKSPMAAYKLGVLIQGITQIIINSAVVAILWLFAGLFLTRYIAIWILVILAPIAFVCWILPATKKFWDMWWANLVQWSVIGIPAAFFFYLAMSSFDLLATAFRAQLTMPGQDTATIAYFNNIFPFFVIIIFLIAGFSIGLSTAAMGAPAIIKGLKTAGKATTRWSGRQAGEVFRRATKGKGPEWMAKQASARLPGFAGKSASGKILTAAGYASGLSFARWGAQRGIGSAGLRFAESEREAVKKAEGKYADAIPERLASAIRDPEFPSTDRIAALNQAVEQGKLKDVKELLGEAVKNRLLATGKTMDEAEKGASEEVNKEIVKIGKAALRVHPDQFKKIHDAFPHLAEKMGEGFSDEIKEKAGLTLTAAETAAGITVPMKITAKLKPSFVPKMDKDALKNNHVKTGIHNSWTGAHIAQLDKESLDEFCDDAVSLFGGMPWYRVNNPLLATYLQSSAARGLGINIP